MERRIEIAEKILDANDRLALENRSILDGAKVFAINLMASPGAGKTSLIENTIDHLIGQFAIAVIDGDIATDLDAQRAAKAGAIAHQINTGGECHLNAQMVREALARIDMNMVDLLIIENVGNLICPASFQLGTHKSVLVASIPEGDDKPYKYPGMYRGVNALVINKIDLLPYIDFDLDYFKRGVEILNPGLRTFELSCRTGQGFEQWTAWLISEINLRKAPAN
jgi:hydrogenase nickel incorporation protein HypB